jgi:hypothetical protein
VSRKDPITAEDLKALGEACRIAYDVQNTAMRNPLISYRATEVIQQDAGATMAVWEKLDQLKPVAIQEQDLRERIAEEIVRKVEELRAKGIKFTSEHAIGVVKYK